MVQFSPLKFCRTFLVSSCVLKKVIIIVAFHLKCRLKIKQANIRQFHDIVTQVSKKGPLGIQKHFKMSVIQGTLYLERHCNLGTMKISQKNSNKFAKGKNYKTEDDTSEEKSQQIDIFNKVHFLVCLDQIFWHANNSVLISTNQCIKI